jgi:nucleoid DNA-binding protein
MTFSELRDEVARRTGRSKFIVDQIWEETDSLISEEMAAGREVQFGLGTFVINKRASRRGWNPITHEHITIPEMKQPHLRIGGILKDAVRKGIVYKPYPRKTDAKV